jgi:hypothetical protein
MQHDPKEIKMTDQPFDKMLSENDADQTPDSSLAEVEAPQTGIQIGNFSSHVDFSSDDIVIPRIRLAQGLTAEVQDGTAKPGQWLLTGFDPVDELTVVPVMFSRQRALRDDEGAVLCKSQDSITGEGIPGGTCQFCPMNQWADGPKGERVPPQCVFSYVYIVYVAEFESMALIEFRRTNIQAGKTVNTMAAQRGLGNFAVKVKAAKQQGKRGTFYSTIVQPVTVDKKVLEAARAFTGS